MEKKFYFGKIAYNGEAKHNSVEVRIRYEKAEKGYAFAASGYIWNASHSDILCGGQCIDMIAEYIDNPAFKEIHELWKLYHLNDMRSECVHQAELGWKELRKKEVCLYSFSITSEAFSSQRRLERTILDRVIAGEPVNLTEEERKILGLELGITSHTDTLPEDIAEYYYLGEIKKETLGHLRESEHPEGLLCRPCPVCGYKYGTSRKFHEIPDADKARIERLMSAEIPSIQYKSK